MFIMETKDLPLEVQGFFKRYKGNKQYSVNNASFKVQRGSFHGFIGANGAGKTTTIKSLIGAYATFKGEISIFGHKYNTMEAKAKLGYIPEAAKFPRELSAYQYV